MKNNDIIVSIRCFAYNHKEYIRDCLEGFVMQKTNFRFEAIVHDDASTDGTTDIIREYAEKYPDIIKPIYETENQYKKHDGSLKRIMNSQMRGKYIAMCEGDDYWIDPLKLQKQVDFLEAHPDYTMCCSDAVIKTPYMELDWCRYNQNQTIPTEDVIMHGGLFVQTATLLFKKELRLNADDYPEAARKCHVGDFPLQIYAALKGKIYWFAEKQAVYRYGWGESWTNSFKKLDIKTKIKRMRSEIDMLKSMDSLSNHAYTKAFKRIETMLVYYIIYDYPDDYKLIVNAFPDVIKDFETKRKIDLFLIKIHCSALVKLRKRIKPKNLINALRRLCAKLRK